MRGPRRNWKIGRPVMAVVLACMAVMLAAHPASADRLVPDPDITLKQLRVTELRAVGLFPTVDMWLPGYGDYQVEDGSYLSLDYNHSDLLRPHDSTMTIVLNDVPLTTVLLGPDSVKRTTLRVPLPKDRLLRDLNHIEVRYAMRLPDVDCIEDDPALWSTIFETSYIHYQYTQPLKFLGLPEPDLALFPEPFLRPTLTEGSLAFILPDGASAQDFSAAASVAAKFGQASGGKPVSTTLHFASKVSPASLPKSDLVVVGRAGDNTFLRELAPSLPLKLSQDRATFVDRAGVPIDPGHGVLQVLRSPWDARFAVLVVSGGDDQGLARAARTLSSRLAMKVLQGPFAIISPSSEELRKVGQPSAGTAATTISFEQIGVGEQTIRNLGKHTTTFSFDAPPTNSQDDAYLDLVMSYSTLIDPVLSSVTVSLNGTPVRSLQLRPEDADRRTTRITLPPGSLRPGLNEVTFVTALYAQNSDFRCMPPGEERAWTVFHRESSFVLPVGSDPVTLDLANLPYPFIRNGVPTGSYLVLPSDGPALESSLQVAVAIGRMCLGDSTELRAGQSGQLPEGVEADYDLVLFGAPENNDVLNEVSPSLPLNLAGGGQRLLQRPELVLLGVNDVANLGVIELIPSPKDSRRAVLALTGTTQEMVVRTPQSLSSKLPRGSVAVITRDEKGDPLIRGIGLAGTIQAPVPETALRRRYLTMAAVPILLLVAASLALMFARVVRR